MDEFEKWYYFSTPVYIAQKPEFLDSVTKVSQKYLKDIQSEITMDDVYPLIQTYDFSRDNEIEDFATFVGNKSWEILQSQGYYLDNRDLLFDGMWLQSHHKSSSMDYHTHGNGNQLVGFYFLKCSENSPKVFIHDPRISKTQSQLPERDMNELTDATSVINFTPQPGMLFITNAWVPHSFSRNYSNEPFEFVHFNLYTNVNSDIESHMPIII